MKKIILTCAALIAAAGGVAHAQTTPEHDLSFNASVTTDYRYRGISQTMRRPALQGGADYTHNPSGFYAGVWASTIKWTKDAGGDGNVEIDLYGGKTGELGGGFSYDVGGLYYYYSSNKLKTVGGWDNANTFEVYGKIGYGPAYLKYSHSLTSLFGALGDNGEKTRGSGYLDLGADFELADGYVLNLHVGHQTINKLTGFDYTDWKVGVTKDFGFAEASLAVVGTDIKPAFIAGNGKNTTKNGLVLTLTKSF